MPYKHIKNPAAADRQGGLQQKIFLGPYGDFDVLQKVLAGEVTIKVAHTFLVNKGFIQVYLTQDTGSVKIEPIGAADRHSFKATGKFLHPGEADAIISLANLCKNDRFIILAPLPGSTELIQIGSDEFQAHIKPSYDTSENGGDGRGTMFEFESYMANITKYQADITLAPAP